MADVREVFREAWSQALASVNQAEQEAESLLGRVAGLSTEDVRRHAREFADRLSLQRREVERAIDDAARRAAARFRVPTRGDVEALERRLEVVTKRIEALSNERRGPEKEGASE